MEDSLQLCRFSNYEVFFYSDHKFKQSLFKQKQQRLQTARVTRVSQCTQIMIDYFSASRVVIHTRVKSQVGNKLYQQYWNNIVVLPKHLSWNIHKLPTFFYKLLSLQKTFHLVLSGTSVLLNIAYRSTRT